MYGQGYDRYAPRAPPVKEGEEIDVRIEAVGEKGDGVAKKDGFVLFVPNVKEGDEVRIRITKVLRKVGFAEVIGQAQGPVAQSEPKERPARSQADTQAREREEFVKEVEDVEATEDFGEESEEPLSEEEDSLPAETDDLVEEEPLPDSEDVDEELLPAVDEEEPAEPLEDDEELKE